jgi:protein arginine kinase activator
MNCDYCDKPAVVHEMTVKNGIKKEVHLCQEHAAEVGIDLPEQQPITQLLTHVTISQAPGRRRRERRVCPTCETSYAEFRKTGTLGCPDCYEAFDALLSPLIERAQNGATHHAGKTPRRAGCSIDRQLHVQRLLKELDCAVAAEQYERAAQIRDQICTLRTPQTTEGS